MDSNGFVPVHMILAASRINRAIHYWNLSFLAFLYFGWQCGESDGSAEKMEQVLMSSTEAVNN